jgi:type III secretory pathway component EscS
MLAVIAGLVLLGGWMGHEIATFATRVFVLAAAR